MKTAILAAAAVAALGLAACGKSNTTAKDEGTLGPQGSTVAAAMPDTSAKPAQDALQTAPDAGATGAVPANGAPPAVSPTPNSGTTEGATGTGPGAAPPPAR